MPGYSTVWKKSGFICESSSPSTFPSITPSLLPSIAPTKPLKCNAHKDCQRSSYSTYCAVINGSNWCYGPLGDCCISGKPNPIKGVCPIYSGCMSLKGAEHLSGFYLMIWSLLSVIIVLTAYIMARSFYKCYNIKGNINTVINDVELLNHYENIAREIEEGREQIGEISEFGSDIVDNEGEGEPSW